MSHADFYWNEHWDFRSGDVPVVLEWEGGRAEGVLYDRGAPRTAAAVLEALPLRIPVIHAIWSGDFVMSTQAYDLGVDEAENATRLPRPGDISWDPKFGELGFTYGTAECRMPSGPNTIVVFGQLRTGLDELAQFGRARRFDGLGHVELREGAR